MPDAVQVLLNSIFSFIYLFVISKLLGKKQVAQLTVVDYVIGISIGSVASDWCTDADNPWYYYAIGMGVFFVLSSFVDILERKTPFLKDILKGKEIVVVENGEINYKNLKKSKLDVNDLLGLCREKGYFDLNSVGYVYFENNGAISVLPKGEERPSVAKDFKKLEIKKASPSTYLIVDGKICKDALKQLNKDFSWLCKKLSIKKKKQIKNILLLEYLAESNSFKVHYKIKP